MIGIILIPPLFASLLEMFQKPGDVLLGQHLTAIGALGWSTLRSGCLYARVSPL